MPDDIASLTARTGFRRWPWPPLLPFRDDEPDIVGLITGTAGDRSGDVLNALKDGGIRVCAVIGRDDSGSAAPDAGSAAPLVSVLWTAAREFGRNDSAVRFPRIRLVARVAAVALNHPDAEPADVLRQKLREVWSTRDGSAAPQKNILVTTFQRWPYPFALLGDLAALLVWSQFWLWFRGTPGLGPEFRWLRRQRKYLAPAETFETFLLRLPGSAAVELLAAQAFLEDLRVSYQPRRWNWRSWRRNRRPVLILDHPGSSLPALLDKARTVARGQGAKPDPLLIVLTPWSDGQSHDFRLRVVHQVGDPRHIRYPQPNHPWRALLASGAAPMCIIAVAVIVALRLTGVLGAIPWPGLSGPAAHASASACIPGTGQNSETDLVAWPDHEGKDTECVGFSESSDVFISPGPAASPQQQKQERRMIFDQNQMFKDNAQIANAARNPDSQSAPVYKIVYFAGLTESRDDEYDSAEAEELEGLYAAQQSVLGNPHMPQLEVIIANGGAKMGDAQQVARMIIKRFRGDKHFLGVVGLDRSTGAVQKAIKEFTRAAVPMLATTLSADQIGGGSPYFFSLSPTNTAEAKLMLLYVEKAVPQFFKQSARAYNSGGSITARHIVVYQPDVTGQPGSNDADLYISSLVHDLEQQEKYYPTLPRLTVTKKLDDSALCGAATVDIYAGRHDLPLDTRGASRNDDFTQFLDQVGHCGSAPPFVIADDGVSRFVADPGDRRDLSTNTKLRVSYVTKGIRILDTGTECLHENTAVRVAPNLADLCRQYAQIATALRRQGIALLWTGERVGLAYDAAQMFLQVALSHWQNNKAISRAEIPGAFENATYRLATGSVRFTSTLHTGVDQRGGMPLAIVRIRIACPTAVPVKAFDGFDGDQLRAIPNLHSQACPG